MNYEEGSVNDMPEVAMENIPLITTQEELVKACEPVQSILLCGQTSAANKLGIAQTLAETLCGERVLYINCDWKHPSNYPGLTDLLEESAARKDSDLPATLERLKLAQGNCDVLPLGTRVDRATELLGTSIMQQLIECAKNEYAYIVLGMPGTDKIRTKQALLVHADAALLLEGQLSKRRRQALMKILYDDDWSTVGVIREKDMPLHRFEQACAAI